MRIIRILERLIDALDRQSIAIQTHTMGLLQMSTASDRLAASIEAFDVAATARINTLSDENDTLTKRIAELEANSADETTLNTLADHVDELTAGITAPASPPPV